MFADTIGVGVPRQVRQLVGGGGRRSASRSACTCTTRATRAIANAFAARRGRGDGARRVGRRHRRLPVRAARDREHRTEDLVYLLHGEGIETGIDLDALVGVAEWLEGVLGRELEGQVYGPASSRRSPAETEGERDGVQARGRRRWHVHRPLPRQRRERGAQFRVKTPSTPADPSQGVLTGVRRICEEAGIDVGDLRNILHGTTVATNAVLESKGARVGLITTQGFKQILHLARSQTPGPLAGWIIMIKPDPPASLADTREAVERMDARGDDASSPVDEAQVEEIVRDLVESGVESLTVGLINSYVNPRARGADRRDRRAALPGLPGHALGARAAGVPRVRADADRVHELLRAAEGRDLRRAPAERARRRSARRPRSTSCAPTPA